MKLLHSRTIAGCFLLIAFGIAQAASIDEQRAKQFAGMLKNCGESGANSKCFRQLPERLFDGDNLRASDVASMNQATNMLQQYRSHYQRLAKDWNRNKSLQEHPEAPQFLAQLQARRGYIETLSAAIESGARTVNEVDSVCGTFHAEVMNDDHAFAVMVLRDKRKIFDHRLEEELPRLRSSADSLHRACELPKYKQVAQTDCRARVVVGRLDEMTSPRVWCETARNRDELIASFADKRINGMLNETSPLWDVSRYGSIRSPVPVVWADRNLSDSVIDKIATRFNAIYEMAGLDKRFVPNGQTLLTLEAKFAENRRNITANLDRDKNPDNTSAVPSYGLTLGKARIKRWYPNARIIKAGMFSSNYRIFKNELDLPTHRTATGWVKYQVRDDEYCRIGQFKFAEDYSGGGRYERASRVVLESERFIRC